MISASQEERLKVLLENLETVIKELDTRPKDFVQQTIDRFYNYGNRIILSSRQWDWLEDLHNKHCSHAPVLPKLDDLEEEWPGPEGPPSKRGSRKDDMDDEIPF